MVKEGTMKLDGNAAGKALAAAIGALYVVCYAGFYVFGDGMMKLGKYLFHGVALETQPLSLANAAIGLVAWLAVGFAAGYAFAWLYNRFSK
ncbi:hypothetical protein HZC09_00550 [Candidatus Micrarchaeota archaeon]|nr:hypothetical protein [Candidatus Micrarchaeota archaeon]